MINNLNASEVKINRVDKFIGESKLKEIKETNNMEIDNNDSISINKNSESTLSNTLKDSQNEPFETFPDSTNDLKLFSKRILCELIKFEIEECEIKEITEIANSLNPVIDIILNKSRVKINHMQNFITYFVELNSDLIKIIPEYKDLKEEITFRFIISAKNIYNFAFEVYFSLYDLYNVRIKC